MRVIAGSARRTLLKTPEGLDTRPTTDRTKETLFNILNGYLADSNFLDLFSGSGAIGIEALSRGAAFAVFSEISKPALECIKTNVKTTHFENSCQIIEQDAVSAIRILKTQHKKFDVIFMDPPYGKELEKAVLSELLVSGILTNDTLIVIEASLHTDFSYADAMGYEVFREKKYKTSKHVFIKIKE